MKFYFIILFFTFQFISFSQSAIKVNQYNSGGDKMGLWEQHLDEKLQPTKNKDFKYIVYNRYDTDGRIIYEYNWENWIKKDTIYFELDSNYSMFNKLISGVFYQKSEKLII